MELIPAIDLIGGECVRLVQGDYGRKTVYSPDPLEVARGFEGEGARWLHVVDLDGAKAGSPVNLDVVERIARGTGLRVEMGGGLRSEESVLRALGAGVERCVVGSRLAGDEGVLGWFGRFGSQLAAGIDMRDGRVAVQGWEETSGVLGIELGRRLAAAGCATFIVTDIATDGTLSGPNLRLMREWASEFGSGVVASGGVSVLGDLVDLAACGAGGVIVGKALYESRFSVREGLKILEEIVPNA